MLKRFFISCLLLSLFLGLALALPISATEKTYEISETQLNEWIGELQLSRQKLQQANERITNSEFNLQQALDIQQKQKEELEKLKQENEELLNIIASLKDSLQKQVNLTEEQAKRYKKLIEEFNLWKQDYETLKTAMEAEINRLEREIRREKVKKWLYSIAAGIAGYCLGKI